MGRTKNGYWDGHSDGRRYVGGGWWDNGGNPPPRKSADYRRAHRARLIYDENVCSCGVRWRKGERHP